MRGTPSHVPEANAGTEAGIPWMIDRPPVYHWTSAIMIDVVPMVAMNDSTRNTVMTNPLNAPSSSPETVPTRMPAQTGAWWSAYAEAVAIAASPVMLPID